MRIAIVGTGYVGLVSAACFAELGHEVIGVDIDAAKVKKLKSGKSPIYEPGLEELIVKNLKTKRLSFTTDLTEALPHVDIVFSAVATPPDKDHRADLKAVFIVAETVAKHVTKDIIFVNKSTVPVGTGKICEEKIGAILKKRGMDVSVPVISNPEFLREGMAVPDTLMPDRIVVGINREAADHDPQYDRAVKMVEELYRPITRVGKPLVFMSRESAEIVKYASNAFLATKISFINMLAELAEKAGADVRSIATGMGLDGRIGPRFLHAGIGYGGSCFPKDIKALLVTAKDYGVDMSIVASTDRINQRARERFIEKILKRVPKKSVIAVWGVSFKPKTDDMRDAPSLDIIPALLKAGHKVKAYDPVAMDHAKKLLPKEVEFTKDAKSALKDAAALAVLTEWDEFRGVDLGDILDLMDGKLLFDGRNVYEPREVRAAGLQYFGMGVA
jgi:UDPglucose 6-dehydrogenase